MGKKQNSAKKKSKYTSIARKLAANKFLVFAGYFIWAVIITLIIIGVISALK